MIHLVLPYESAYETAKVLDDSQLAVQVVAARTTLMILMEELEWDNNNTVLAWWGHEEALAVHGLYMSSALRERGLEQKGVYSWFTARRYILRDGGRHMTNRPPWVSDSRIHEAYRKLLVLQNPEHYEPHFGYYPDDPDWEFPWHLLKEGPAHGRVHEATGAPGGAPQGR